MVIVTVTALAGVWAPSGAVEGYLVRSIGLIEWISLTVSGCLLFYAGTIHDVIGALIMAVILVVQIHRTSSEERRAVEIIRSRLPFVSG
jgi:TRAP-type uncharacterized transport system fused permease subunit